ncbi:MAG TPA: hypothetical protein VIF57_11905 [Polyangia bacterium]|jgi:hypothetical protein
MNRLRDGLGNGPVSERGIELLRETPATTAMRDLKRRVWSSLKDVPPQPAAWLGVRGVKALALGVTVLSLAGTAGAVITGRWLAPAFERAQPAAPRTERRRVVRRIAAPPALEEASAAAPAPEPPPPTPPARKAQTPAPARAAVGVSAPVARAAAASSTQERTQVLDALIALRRDHDPARAGALLQQYLTAHPRGALREEALVLAIEAGDARGDHARAQRLARAYQNEYPRGRFQQFARSHTHSQPDPDPAPAATPPR